MVEFRYGRTILKVNMPDTRALLRAVSDRLADGQGFALATINLDHLVKLRRSDAFLNAYAAHDLIVADGNPIVWLSRLAGRPVDLVPGSDLVLPLSQVAASRGVPIALVGSTPGALDAAAAHLTTAVPGLEVVLKLSPPMGFDPTGAEAADILHQVEDSGARLCFLALGAPRQELMAARGRVLAPSVGFASVGAGLDFLAGQQARAPRWMRAMALEWVWRLATSPRRLTARYLACLAILPSEASRALALRHLG